MPTTVLNAAVITIVGSLALVLARAGKGQFDVLNAQFAGVKAGSTRSTRGSTRLK